MLCATAPTAQAEQDYDFDVGGAVRFNYSWLDYGPTAGDGDFDLELVRFNSSGHVGRAFYSLEYRWYQDFDAVHHAYAGVKLGEDSDIRAGVVQVPFGLLPYASQSFWFGSGYYLGIEDDYDAGIVWQRKSGPHQLHAAYFAGDEYGTGKRYDRYSFDVAQTEQLPYRERRRVNLRYEHASDGGGLTWGASAYAGHVQNRDSGRDYGQYGAALHGQWKQGPATVQLQWARYRYDVPGSRIAMSAFLFPFEIAAEADVPTFNVAYAVPRSGWFDGMTCYNNFSMTRPVDRTPDLGDSYQNVTGCSFAKGPMFTYVDWIAGRNMWFVGGSGIGIEEPASDRWRSRLNVNVGFYF
ncbi:hypothetical protein ABB29_02650 [Pseudoxanthomonas dokdonensis]|uniref:Porin domain-containing protein n=1 Tax=Pseudoxanthomonas dokdonensis TaxID=344882 RepID=A0A0R0CPC9_9GAMM|nr:hypothetical protein ABB29_02650 [Pseudoxanthomonas dokdonensis]